MQHRRSEFVWRAVGKGSESMNHTSSKKRPPTIKMARRDRPGDALKRGLVTGHSALILGMLVGEVHPGGKDFPVHRGAQTLGEGDQGLDGASAGDAVSADDCGGLAADCKEGGGGGKTIRDRAGPAGGPRRGALTAAWVSLGHDVDRQRHERRGRSELRGRS